ncbi:MAG: hypothetical protein H6550_01080 [Chitinophagales bacterium]|nr:hypothetical protein [Chitinophagales bacterium]
MDIHHRYYYYLGVLLLAILIGLYKVRTKDITVKIIVLLLSLTFVSELIAKISASVFHNNMYVYHIFAPVQLLVLGIYFDSIEPRFKKKRIGLIIGLAGVLIAICNTLLFQPPTALNSNFLLFEGLAVMALSLFTFQRILNDDKIDIYKYPYFWFNIILVFFWSITYTIWALHSVIMLKKMYIMEHLYDILWVVNIITYLAIAAVLFIFSNKRLSHEG